VNAVRRNRLEAGLTLPKLAAEVGLPYHVVRRADSGGRIREDNAKLVADYFGISVFAVLGEAEKGNGAAA
jgi:ribosome-binding protein aMBF1 (putative translation factor)